MEKYIVTKQSLYKLAQEISTEFASYFADKERIRFTDNLPEYDFFLLNNIKPTNISFKEYFFPKQEAVFHYKITNTDVKIQAPKPIETKMIFWGVKPCDAASIPILEHIFNWDYKDELFNNRVKNSVIITLGCDYSDESCFCTSVGLNQDTNKGSDLFLTPLLNDKFLVEVITDKGKDLIENRKIDIEQITEIDSSLVAPKLSKSPDVKFDKKEAKTWLEKNFNHKFWDSEGELCLGCAQCAFVCPTCHCFDLVDESCNSSCGSRVKNWDGCQFSLFTKHAGGHNPRESQEKRYRQRINHKFNIYDEKFGEILCTGCGRCSRGCPVGYDIAEIVSRMSKTETIMN